MERLNFQNTTFSRCDFTDSNLRHSNFSNTKIDHTKFLHSDLRSCNFSGTKFNSINLSNALINRKSTFDEITEFEKEARNEDNDLRYRIFAAKKAINLYKSLQNLYERTGIEDHAKNCYRRFMQSRSLLNSLEGQKSYENFKEEYQLSDIYKFFNSKVESSVDSFLRKFFDYFLSPSRIIIISCCVIIAFAIGYISLPWAGVSSKETIITLESFKGWEVLSKFSRSLYFSTVTFVTLGYGDLTPVYLSKTLSMIESYLGAIFIAALIFSLGRRIRI